MCPKLGHICTGELAPALLEPTVQWKLQRSKQAVINYFSETNAGSSCGLIRLVDI